MFLKGSGCQACPESERGCDAQYRGSRCAALRAKAGVDFDPQTNADRIRAMSDEELAVFLNSFAEPCGYCEYKDGETPCDVLGCKAAMMNWLRAPACKEGE